jgi:hypothetical protein
MSAAFTARLVCSLALVSTVATIAPANGRAGHLRPTATTSNLRWYWSQSNLQQTLLHNGVNWTSGLDSVAYVKCSGLGSWIVQSGTAMFHDFHCYVRPYGSTPYNVIIHVVSQWTYRYGWAGWGIKQVWWWPTQYAANTLVSSGIRWSSGLDRIVASSCSHFGPSSLISGAFYYKLFYCTVTPATGYSYSIVLDATQKTSAAIWFVSYTLELPVTPASTTPVPSSSNTNSQQLNTIIGRNQDNQLFLSTVQHSYESNSQSTYGTGTGMFGGSSCTWPVC